MDPKALFRRLLEPSLFAAAIVLPLGAALGRVATAPAWRDDLPAVRSVGLVAVGSPATITTVANQLASLVPLGPLNFRMALVSAIALAVCAGLVQLLARRLLEMHVPGSGLNAPLASIAALTATLGPALQSEATVGGGATVSLAVGLLAVLAYFGNESVRERRYVLTSLALAALLSESLIAGGVVAVAIVLAGILRRDLPTARQTLLTLGTLLAGTIVLMLPSALRPSAPHVSLDLGRNVTMDILELVDTAAKRTTALAAWRAEVGSISLGIAGLGLVMGLLRKRTRPLALCLALPIATDALFPASSGSVLLVDPLTPLRVVALSCVAVVAALGVQAAATTLIDMHLPMARAAAVLLVVFNLTLVAVTSEQAAFSVDRGNRRGATAYTEEALDKLDPNAMLLVRSQSVAWRILSAQIISGSRPDALLVAFPLIHRGHVASRVLAAEPVAAMLLRDMTMDGAPGEHALSRLADHRPLYVELDPRWDQTIARHLAVSGLWLKVHPHPVGSSDRKAAIEGAAKPLARVGAELVVNEAKDHATEAVLISAVRQQAVAAALARDKSATQTLLEQISKISPEDLFVRTLAQRLDHARGGDIDVSGLVR